MNITKTSSEAQRERDELNKLIYRRINAREQGCTCPECGKSYCIPNIIEHCMEYAYGFKFACKSCGCEWASNAYDVDWRELELLATNILARNIISWLLLKSAFKRIANNDMKALEDGYDPSIDYGIKEQEQLNRGN